MKKYIFLWIALLSVALSACNDDDNNKTRDPFEIVISTPSDGASYNLEQGQSITFGWTDVPGIDAYKLVISLSESLSLPQSMTADANPFTVSARDFDRMAVRLNILSNETQTIYWSILPLKASQVAKTGKGTIVITRRNIPVIILPETSDVTIDAREYEPYEFTWTPVPAVSEYTIKFAMDGNKFESIGEHVSFDLPTGVNKFVFETMEDFDDMLRTLGLSFSEEQEIFWTVEPTLPSEDALSQLRYFSGVRRKAEIYLFEPEENAVIDMNSYSTQTFEWFDVPGLTEYLIKFSSFPDKFDVEGAYISFEPGFRNATYSFATEASFDELLAALGICYGDAQTVYWSVEPLAYTEGVVPHVSHFTGIRKEVPEGLSISLITAPASGKVMMANTYNMPLQFDANYPPKGYVHPPVTDPPTLPDMSYFTSYFPLRFDATRIEWTAVSVSQNYFIRFSKSDQFPDNAEETFSIYVAGNTSYNLSKGAFEDVIAAIGTGVWYWKVVPANDPCGSIVSEVRTLTALKLTHVTGAGDTGYTQSSTTDPKYLFDAEWTVTYLGGTMIAADNPLGTVPWANREVNYRQYSTGYHGGVMANPSFLTLDVGHPVKLRQYRHHYYYPFSQNCPLKWDIWAYTGEGKPTAEDGWNDWEKIAEGDNDHLPNEFAANQQSRIDAYPMGWTVQFERNEVPVAQYYRFRNIENWWLKSTRAPDVRGEFGLSEILCWPFED